MSGQPESTMSFDVSPQGTIMKILMGSYLAQTLRGVAKLGIADHFEEGRKTTAELADAAKVNEGALRRTLRLLTAAGLFKSFPDDQWELTAVGDALRSDSPISMRNAALGANDFVHWGAWGKFPDALQTGKSQVENVFGCDIWEVYKRNPEEAKIFGHFMENVSSFALGPILNSYDFSEASVIADIGGAYGALLAGVLRQNKSASGILLDKAEFLKHAPEVLGDVESRVTCVEGDFFTDKMPEADIYLLKHVIHDWNDEDCVSILKNLSTVMSSTSKILIIETILSDTGERPQALISDLNMLVMVGGMERTQGEFEVLLKKANLQLVRVVETGSPYGIVEAKLEG